MDDMKLFAEKKKRIRNPNKTVMGMEFGIEICYVSNEKLQMTHDGRSRTTESVVIRTLGEKETYKYLGDLEADTIKQVEMKEKIKKEYLRKLLETKLYSRTMSKG